MDKQKTGTIIKEARTKKGYTQLELGNLIGISNKAISRWENGETFPDVGILEDLANALDLKIEEIVLGQIYEKNTENLARELVRTTKLQNNEKKRDVLCFLTSASILLWFILIWFFVMRYQSMSGDLFPHSYSFLFPMLSIMGILFRKSNWDAKNRTAIKAYAADSKHLKNTKKSIVTLLILLSGIYSILLMVGMSTMIQHGSLPAFLPLEKSGPFINIQLNLIYFLNVIYIGLCLFRNLRYKTKISTSAYISVAVTHLQLHYSNSLHHMDTFDTFFRDTIWNSALFVLATTITIMVIHFTTIQRSQNLS